VEEDVMGSKIRLTAIAVAAMAVVFGIGPASQVALADGCATICSVGAAGTGGESSDGNAEGFRLEGPTSFPGTTFTNQGNQIGGKISVTGALEGMAGGALTPQDVLVGHFTGFSAIFFGMDGDCNGVCG
jgi:hypothetical protein